MKNNNGTVSLPLKVTRLLFRSDAFYVQNKYVRTSYCKSEQRRRLTVEEDLHVLFILQPPTTTVTRHSCLLLCKALHLFVHHRTRAVKIPFFLPCSWGRRDGGRKRTFYWIIRVTQGDYFTSGQWEGVRALLIDIDMTWGGGLFVFEAGHRNERGWGTDRERERETEGEKRRTEREGKWAKSKTTYECERYECSLFSFFFPGMHSRLYVHVCVL
jgi:hypothetical protein